MKVFDDYQCLERIFNSKNWTPSYYSQPSLTTDLKWLYKKVVYGLMKLPDVDFNAISEQNFVKEMRQWLRTVSVLKTIPSLKLCST